MLSTNLNHNNRIAIAFYLMLTVYVAWIFMLPAFPSQDGPMHLYYAHVMQRLMDGSPQFHEMYVRQHLLPPECAHLYILVVLLRLMSPEMADKMMAVICVVVVACGLRFLIKSFDDEEPAFTIFAVPLALVWPLFLGLFNFVLGLGLCMFGMGLWCRAFKRRTPWLWIALVCLSIPLVLSHPLGLLLLDIFCGVELLSRLVRDHENNWFRRYRAELLTLFSLFCVSMYVFLYFDPNVPKYFPDAPYTPVKISEIFAAWYITPLQGLPSIPIQFGFLMLLAFALQCALFGVGKRIKERTWETSDVLLLCSLGLFATIPFIPFELNRAAFVGPRMVYVLWLAVAAAAGANYRIARRQHIAITITGILFAVCHLGLIHSQVETVARVISEIPSVPSGNEGRLGILIEDWKRKPKMDTLAFDPFTFSGVKSFLEGDLVLFNGPWLRAPNGLMGNKNDLPSDNQKEHPFLLPDTLASSPPLMDEVRKKIRIVLAEGDDGPELKRKQMIERIFPAGSVRCQPSQYYEMCETAGRSGTIESAP